MITMIILFLWLLANHASIALLGTVLFFTILASPMLAVFTKNAYDLIKGGK